MNKKEYLKANERIKALSHKKDKTPDEISEAITLLEKVQKHELKKKRKLPAKKHS